MSSLGKTKCFSVQHVFLMLQGYIKMITEKTMGNLGGGFLKTFFENKHVAYNVSY